LNVREYLSSDGVSVVEWFDHLPEDEVDECLQISLAYTKGNQRRLTFTARGKRYEEIIKRIRVEGMTA
jgi:tRNA A37 threonylcarbamoyladenosine biosynthesis protein TsaE